jgi:hypothetical protein
MYIDYNEGFYNLVKFLFQKNIIVIKKYTNCDVRENIIDVKSKCVKYQKRHVKSEVFFISGFFFHLKVGIEESIVNASLM